MINFAHRGASCYYPENTILAIKEGIKAGANGVEIDVHKSRDNELVVIHDENIERTFKGEGLVKCFELKELKELECRNNNFTHREDCKIPLLREVLEVVRESNVILNIEIKNDQVQYDDIEEDVIRLVKYYGMKEQVILSSFNHKSMELCKRIDKSFKAGLLCEDKIEEAIYYAKLIKAEAIHPNVKLLSNDIINEIKRNKLMINTYTVDSPIIMSNLIKADINGIFTNCPDLLNEILNKKK